MTEVENMPANWASVKEIEMIDDPMNTKEQLPHNQKFYSSILYDKKFYCGIICIKKLKICTVHV